eukprot:scaffold40361_cov221-Amphora_coffeaeformis.AAC.8
MSCINYRKAVQGCIGLTEASNSLENASVVVTSRSCDPTNPTATPRRISSDKATSCTACQSMVTNEKVYMNKNRSSMSLIEVDDINKEGGRHDNDSDNDNDNDAKGALDDNRVLAQSPGTQRDNDGIAFLHEYDVDVVEMERVHQGQRRDSCEGRVVSDVKESYSPPYSLQWYQHMLGCGITQQEIQRMIQVEQNVDS